MMSIPWVYVLLCRKEYPIKIFSQLDLPGQIIMAFWKDFNLDDPVHCTVEEMFYSLSFSSLCNFQPDIYIEYQLLPADLFPASHSSSR